MERKDYSGERFGRLLVLERLDDYIATVTKNRSAQYRCLCDCGEEVVVLRQNLVSGRTRSCGCLRRENMKKVGAAWAAKRKIS